MPFMSDAKTLKEQREAIRKDLFASQEVLVLKAVREARELGDASLIEPLVQVMMNTQDATVRDSIHALLSELKATAAEKALVAVAQDERYAAVRAEVLSFVWSSGLQPVEDIEVIVRLAVSGDFQVALEAYTILDSLEGPYIEEDVLEAELFVKSWMEDESHAQDERRELLKSVQQMVKNMHRNLQD